MNDYEYAVPANPQEAIEQANRFDRAMKIIEEGYTFTKEPSGMVAVCKPGELFASYWIGEHVDGSNGCDCADKAKRKKPCKHELAWEILQKREADEAADEAANWEAQCAKWEAEEGWAHGETKLPRLRNLLLAELKDAENRAMAIHHEPFCKKDAMYSWLRKADRCKKALLQFDETLTKVQLGLLTL